MVTTTFTAPAPCAAVVPLMAVAVTVETVSADPPNATVAPDWNPVPLTVTAVAPSVDPLAGVTELTVGAGAGPPPPALSASCWMDQKFAALNLIVAGGKVPVTIASLSAA